MLRDKSRFAAIQQLGWTVIPIVVTDVRLQPDRLADRIADHLSRAALAS
jgi:very-short-patch-repair endonuclease